jgi:hypothetical protein
VTPPSAAASLGAPASTATPNAARLNGARSPSSLLLSASSELNPQAAKGLRDGILIGAMVLLGAVLLGARIVTR